MDLIASSDTNATDSFDEFARGLRLGESEATRELLARYSARLVALARGKLRGRLAAKGDADDVLQSVFRTFFRRLGEGEVELRDWASLAGLLSVLTLRKCHRQARAFGAARRDVRRETSLFDGTEGAIAVPAPRRAPRPEEVAAFNELVDGLLSAFGGRDRQVVERVMDGEPVADIAEDLECSRRTVQRVIARAKQRLAAEARAGR